MHISQNFGLPQFFTVVSTICGTVVEENEKHRKIEIRFLGPWSILRLREGEIRFCYVLSVSVVPSVSVESVIESVML